jgi:hypothetical protein
LMKATDSGNRKKVSMKITSILSSRPALAMASRMTLSPAIRAVVKMGLFLVSMTFLRVACSAFSR